MTLKILNLYAGIGGNRKLWTGDIEVTAVENVPEIAKIYQDFFPNDKVIIADAHQYLLEHYKEFDFIWSSPPCPTHSKFRISQPDNLVYPDMKLYEEIILLERWCETKFVIENVCSYYDPLIKPQVLQRHYFWTNFPIDKTVKFKEDHIRDTNVQELTEHHGFDLSNYFGIDKSKLLSNCVYPELGLHVFKMAFKEKQNTLEELKSQVEKE